MTSYNPLYWYLVAATAVVGTHPTGMHSCLPCVSHCLEQCFRLPQILKLQVLSIKYKELLAVSAHYVQLVVERYKLGIKEMWKEKTFDFTCHRIGFFFVILKVGNIDIFLATKTKWSTACITCTSYVLGFTLRTTETLNTLNSIHNNQKIAWDNETYWTYLFLARAMTF